MFEKFKSKAILYPTVIMVLICLVVTAALAGTNLLTESKIEKINEENQNDAMRRVLKADEYIERDFDGTKYFEAHNGNELAGYVYILDEKGYGGTVSVMVAVNPDLSVNAVEALDVTSETPGLGQNTANDSFLKQYKGKSEEITAVKYGTKQNDTQIDAVASATITSKAVTKAVNRALEISNKIINKAVLNGEE